MNAFWRKLTLDRNLTLLFLKHNCSHLDKIFTWNYLQFLFSLLTSLNWKFDLAQRCIKWVKGTSRFFCYFSCLWCEGANYNYNTLRILWNSALNILFSLPFYLGTFKMLRLTAIIGTPHRHADFLIKEHVDTYSDSASIVKMDINHKYIHKLLWIIASSWNFEFTSESYLYHVKIGNIWNFELCFYSCSINLLLTGCLLGISVSSDILNGPKFECFG